MALHQDTIWEVRTGGSNENGGGFHDRIPGTSVDYSQQNAPQLALIDLVGSAASVTVTSVVGGFTAAMVGNVMRIRAGTNFTVGFYEIVARNSANSVDLDRIPCTGAGSVGLSKTGGGQINCDLIDTVVVPGNTVYIENGNYAAHPTVTFSGAYTKTLPLTIWGYNGARNTRPTGLNRPLIALAGNVFNVNTNIKIRNVSFEGTVTTAGNALLKIITASGNGLVFFENCKFNHLSTGRGIITNTPSVNSIIAIDCEFLSATPGGILSIGIDNIGSGQPITVLNCYFHSLSYGINQVGADFAQLYALFSIFANILINGINADGTEGARVMNCVFEDIVGDGFNTGGGGTTIVNNSFSNCVNSGINSPATIVKNNNFFGCGTPWIGGTLRPLDNNTFVNPQFVTPGSNYALQRTSGLIDRAFSMRLGV